MSIGCTRRHQGNALRLDPRPGAHRRRDFPLDVRPRTRRQGWQGRDPRRTKGRRAGLRRPSRDDGRHSRPSPGPPRVPPPGNPGPRSADRHPQRELSRWNAVPRRQDRRPWPMAEAPPSHDVDCGADRTRRRDRRTHGTAPAIRRPRRSADQAGPTADRPGMWPADRTAPTMKLKKARMPETASKMTSRPRRRPEPEQLRGAPIPGRRDRPGTRRTGSRPPGGPGPAARAPTPRSSGAGGPVDPPAHPARPRRRRTDRPATCPRWAALAQSSPR